MNNSTMLIYNNGVIRTGEIVQCSLNPSRRDIAPHEHSNSRHSQGGWLIFNAMFWPTLTFILGFVGVFFSTIFLTKDNWKWDWNCDVCEVSF